MLIQQLTILLPIFIKASVKCVSPELGDTIQFDMPDIVVQFPYPTKTVTLEAFRMHHRNGTSMPKWVSIGYPTIANNSDGRIFHFTTEYVTVYIKTLDQLQQEALVRQAKIQYPNENVLQGSIVPLPLARFACTANIHVNDTSYQIRGNVYDLRTNPSLLRFPLPRGSHKRAVFEKRIEAVDDPLYLECELAATGKPEKIDTLKITSEQMQEIDLADKLLGPSDEKYVVRLQLKKAAREIESRLQIEENYEIENEDFAKIAIQKLLDASVSSFEPIPIDEALNQLSSYGTRFDQRDLSITEIKSKLSNVLQVRTIGGKERIVAARSAYLNVSTLGRLKALWSLVDTSVDTDFVTKKSKDWSKNTSTLDDQLQELNQNSRSEIKWEREGSRIVPSGLTVAVVTRLALTQQMAFSKIKKRLSTSKYHRMYEVGTHNSVFPVDEQQRQFIATIKKPLQELNDSLLENMRSLAVSVREVSLNQETSKTSMTQKIDQVASSLNEKIDEAINTTCVTRTTAGADRNEGVFLLKQQIAVRSLNCDSEQYTNNIQWDWQNETIVKGNVLKASYNCCPLGGSSYYHRCTRKTNDLEAISSYLRLNTDGIALKRLDCGGESWYVNDIIWQDWEKITVNGETVWVLNAEYRCCKCGK